MKIFIFFSFLVSVFSSAYAKDSQEKPLRKVTFATGYIPNVQFTPFYVAVEKGYFKAEGLEVAFNYAMGAEPLKLIAKGDYEFGSADGDALIAAASQNIPLQGVFLLYQQNPVALYSLKSALNSVGDLKGKKVGVPGLFGSTYVNWRLAAQSEPSFDKAQLVPIGYTQVQALIAGRVDAALGFENNEPVALERRGFKVSVWPLRNYAWLPGNGIVVSNAFLKKEPELVKKFLRAIHKGLSDTIDKPDDMFKLVQGKYLSSLKGDLVGEQLEVLKKTTPLWKTPTPAMKLGTYQFPKLTRAIDAMTKAKLIQKTIDPHTVFTNEFLP